MGLTKKKENTNIISLFKRIEDAQDKELSPVAQEENRNCEEQIVPNLIYVHLTTQGQRYSNIVEVLPEKGADVNE